MPILSSVETPETAARAGLGARGRAAAAARRRRSASLWGVGEQIDVDHRPRARALGVDRVVLGPGEGVDGERDRLAHRHARQARASSSACSRSCSSRCASAGVDLPAAVPESLVVIALGALATIFVLVRAISIPDEFFFAGRGIGIWISLVAAVALIVAGLLQASEEL